LAKAEKFQFLKHILKFYTLIGVVFVLLGIALILTPTVLPTIWYSLNQDATEGEFDSINTVVEAAEEDRQEVIDGNHDEVKLPPFDDSLSKTNKLIIPKIGVSAPINEDPIGKRGLEKGVWRTHDWGTPESNYSTILASHRFGYVFWTQDFRNKNSFYNLPNLAVGDDVEVIWNQRKYVYKVYKAETGKKFSDLDADLILYTCQMYNSPIRIFRYLNRIN
jgi:sortase (surface protein transpeptidase)